VGVGEDDVVVESFFVDQMVAEPTDTRAGVDNDDIIA
jgi:hypothetical protein